MCNECVRIFRSLVIKKILSVCLCACESDDGLRAYVCEHEPIVYWACHTIRCVCVCTVCTMKTVRVCSTSIVIVFGWRAPRRVCSYARDHSLSFLVYFHSLILSQTHVWMPSTTMSARTCLYMAVCLSVRRRCVTCVRAYVYNNSTEWNEHKRYSKYMHGTKKKKYRRLTAGVSVRVWCVCAL